MSLLLPLDSTEPHFSFSCELEGTTYGFTFLWVAESPGWFLSIASADGTELLSGVRVVADWNLLKSYRDARLPPGLLIPQDTEGARQDPGRDDLGKRTLILYFTAAEAAAL